MATYFGFMNYLIFFSLYIICFYFVFQPYSEIIGIYTLFIVHTAFSAFIGKDLMNIFMNDSIMKSSQLGLITISLLIALLIGNSFHFVSLILIIMMISNLQSKYDSSRGTPIKLPNKYKYKLNQFKYNCIFVFIISLIFLLILFFNFDLINIPLKPLFDNLTYDNFIKRVPSLIVLGFSFISLFISVRQIYIANDLSKLKNKQLLHK